MLPSDIRSMQEAYRNVYGEFDFLTDDLIEEIVCELVEECVEFGYTLDESVVAVEEAATEYLMEINPYAPAGSKGAKEYQRSTTSTKREAERTAAVKGAVERVKSMTKGVKAAAGIAGSIAKDEVGRVGRSATHAVGKSANAVGSAVKGAAGAVSTAFSNKKAEVKQGVKSLLGRGLRKVAGAVGNVAQRASGAASRLGEEYTAYDIILEHLITEGYADTNKSALVIMSNMSEEWRQSIVEEVFDEARRADKLGYERGTAANPNIRNISHSDPSQRTMLNSKVRRRAEEMGRERRNSPKYKQGARPPLSAKEKSFLKFADRSSPTSGNPRNPNVQDTGSQTTWPSERRAQKDPKQNPKHNANRDNDK